jgi:hypothetical protein
MPTRFGAIFSTRRKTLIRLGLLVLLLAGYGWLPIRGHVLLVPEGWRERQAWPRVYLDPPNPQPGQRATIAVTDTTPWTHIKLVVAGDTASYERYVENPQAGYWTWYWSFTVPPQPEYEVILYHDCDTGCRERTRVTVGAPEPHTTEQPTVRLPTKLGVVFASPARDWHNRTGWTVELTYAMQAEKPYWGVDDLAERVQRADVDGLRVLVRVDYDQGQSLPPKDDALALDVYLRYLWRLARDERLRTVYGYVIGSSYNTQSSNSQAPDAMVTPEWYARVFNGYGTDPTRNDNIVAILRAERPTVRVLVGPVRPGSSDQNGRLRYRIDAPWLNYMNTLVAALDEAAQQRAWAAPDGFAIQAPGRPDAPEFGSTPNPDEPTLDLRRAEWNGAQMGFRVFEDWLDIINAYPTTRGLPVFITSTNTFALGSAAEPAENYPPGWLTNALEMVNREPQIQALCWFVDEFPLDKQWELYSLTDPHGLLVEAAAEFDQLLSASP